MAESYIQTVLQQKLAIHGIGGDKIKPILEATKVRAKMGEYRLLGLNFTTSKVGFILHHGFQGVRQGGDVYLKAARFHKNKTTREAHKVNLPAKEIFDDLYQKSGALDYLIKSLGETRMQGEINKLQNLVFQVNELKNG